MHCSHCGLCITTLMCCCLQVQLSMSRRMPWVLVRCMYSILPYTAEQPAGVHPFDTSHCLSVWLLQLLASTHHHHRSAQPCVYHVHFAPLEVLARHCWQVVMQMCLSSQTSQQPSGMKSCISRLICHGRAKHLCLHITACNLIYSAAPVPQCCIAPCCLS